MYTYKTLGNEFAVPGKTVADVKFYAADARVSTASFVFEVSGDTMDGLGAGAGGYSVRLEQLATEAEDAMKNAENVSKELENLLTVYQNKFGEVGVLNPKGTYNSATIYEAFDLVYYGGVSWLCLKNCAGVTPAEGAYWQLFASADGGNASKLGGKRASEYLLYNGFNLGKIASYIEYTADTVNCNDMNVGICLGQDLADGSLNFPTTGYFWYIITFNYVDHAKKQIAVRYDGGNEYYSRTRYNGTWSAWENPFANYLPKNGGRGNNIYLTQDAVNGQGYTNMYKNNSATADFGTFIYDKSADGKTTGICIQTNKGVFEYQDTSGAWQKILHTGNKPTGTYTGNGSATARNIAVNAGVYCTALLVHNENGFMIVSTKGAIGIDVGGNLRTLPYNKAQFWGTNLELFTDDNILNASGITTYWQTL